LGLSLLTVGSHPPLQPDRCLNGQAAAGAFALGIWLWARLVQNDAPHTPRTHVDRDAHLPNGRKFAMRNLQLR
jgi:hypothetical protein